MILVEWSVYVLLSPRLGRTYVGCTTDVLRRLAQHNGEQRGGARSTQAGRPWTLAACYGPYPTRSAALCAELRVKRLRGTARLRADEPPHTKPGGVLGTKPGGGGAP